MKKKDDKKKLVVLKNWIVYVDEVGKVYLKDTNNIMYEATLEEIL